MGPHREEDFTLVLGHRRYWNDRSKRGLWSVGAMKGDDDM